MSGIILALVLNLALVGATFGMAWLLWGQPLRDLVVKNAQLVERLNRYINRPCNKCLASREDLACTLALVGIDISECLDDKGDYSLVKMQQQLRKPRDSRF